MTTEHRTCNYKDVDGFICSAKATESGLCFWHDPDIDKTGPEIKRQLEEYVRSGGQTRGIVLKNADLSGGDNYNHFEYLLRLNYKRIAKKTIGFAWYHPGWKPSSVEVWIND